MRYQEKQTEPYLTTNHALIDQVSASVTKHTGRKPNLKTDGGTSDAAYSSYACIELGLWQNATSVNEHVSLQDDALTNIYTQLMRFCGNASSTKPKLFHCSSKRFKIEV